MRRLFLFTIFGFLALAVPSLEAATLHAIIVGHTEDETCGDAITVSVSKIHQECQRIAQYADMDLKETILSGSDYDPNLVLKAVKELNTEPDDVVLYYHNSHGFRLNSSTDPWPSALFPDHRRSLRIGYIASLIANKPHRLSLTLVDACNVPLKRGFPPVFARHSYQDEKRMRAAYYALFRNSAGDIIACSAKPGQVAWCCSFSGAVFTDQWLQSIKYFSDSNKPNWCQVMERAVSQTMKTVGHYYCEDPQEPCYKTDLK